MLQYAEPADVRTLILVAPVSCTESQDDATSQLLAVSSSLGPPAPSLYVVGPIDPTMFIPVRVRLSSGETIACSIPPSIPLAVLTHPFFQEGCEWGYSETDLEEEAYTFPKLLNEVFGMLDELRFIEESDFCPWTLGFVLGELACLAEQDRILALIGLAHYCFVLSFLSPGSWGYPFLRLMWMRDPHTQAMKAYRARVRMYREQGKSFAEAHGRAT
ncbi:MAG: hypothetical protein WCD86_12000 [Ktedonobacteraceae bacterium]